MKSKALILSPIGKFILDSLNSGLVLFDIEGNIILANQRAPQLYMFRDPQNFENRHFCEVFPAQLNKAIQTIFPTVLEGITKRIDEIQVHTPNRDIAYFGATLNPLTNESGEVIGISMNGTNITRFVLESKERKELKELNDRLNFLLDQFKKQNRQLQLANVRNETILNTITQNSATPLTVILNTLEIVQKSPQFQELNEYYELISKQVEELTKIRDQTSRLNQNTIDPGKIKTVSLAALIKPVIENKSGFIIEKKLEIDIIFEFPNVHCECIPEEIATAFEYLLDNAITYTPQGGKISINDRIWENYYFITIEDTGIGIHPDDLPNVFTPFFRGRNAIFSSEANGLNLTLAKNIIEKHNGSISIESTLDKGTSITFYLKAKSF